MLLFSLFPATVLGNEVDQYTYEQEREIDVKTEHEVGYGDLNETQQDVRQQEKNEASVWESVYLEQKVRASYEKLVDYYVNHPPTYPYLGENRRTTLHSDYWIFTGLWASGFTDLKHDFPWIPGETPFEDYSYWTIGKREDRNTNVGAKEDAGTIIGAVLIGKDPRKFGNEQYRRDVVQDLINKQKTDGSFSDVYGDPWVMIALDLVDAEYDRQRLIECMLDRQTVRGNIGPADSTGWTLIALAPYRDQERVKQGIERAVESIHAAFHANGTIPWQMGGPNANSASAIIHGLAAVGENLLSDKWTAEIDGRRINIVEQYIDQYQLEDGRFQWKENRLGAWSICSEQALLALIEVLEDQSTFARLYGYRQNVLDQTTRVSIRVEGQLETLLTERDVRVKSIGERATILDALKQALSAEQISFEIEGIGSNPVIKRIGPDQAGMVNGIGKWHVLVNGKKPTKGVNGHELVSDDQLVFYYGHVADIYQGSTDAQHVEQLTLIPNIRISPTRLLEGEPFEIHISATYNVYDETENLVQEGLNVNIERASVHFNGKNYQTNASGVARIPAAEALAGTYDIAITKDIDQSYPRLLRQIKRIHIVEEAKEKPDTPQEERVTVSVQRSVGEGYILRPTFIDLQPGDTAYTVLVRALPGKVDAVGHGATLYVRSIDGLGEFDRGANSGWMYAVNGYFPDYSAALYELMPGDRVEWRYTLDLGRDIGGYDPPDEEKNGSSGSANVDEVKYTEDASLALEHALRWIKEKDHWSEWDVLALALAGEIIPSSYLQGLEQLLQEQKGEFRKVTDYERIVLTLSAIGQDPRDFAGYDLIEKIYNHERMTMQGINGLAFALLALDSKNYPVPDDALWDRERLLEYILAQQNKDGGFSLSENQELSDVDLTAMVLQALVHYKDRPDVQSAIDRALVWLSDQQHEQGGYMNADGEVNSESIAQVIIALTGLGIDPVSDARFVKEDGNLVDQLLSFATSDGGFAHVHGEQSNDMATEQAALALLALKRMKTNASFLYDMRTNEVDRVTLPFSDSTQISSWAVEAVQSIWKTGIMQGTGDPDPRFEPGRAITRAEFATLLTKLSALENADKTILTYADVHPRDWYADSIAIAMEHGWMQGKSETYFEPNEAITREEMAVVLSRYLALEDQPNDEEQTEIRDLQHVSGWAHSHVIRVQRSGLMIGNNGFFHPQDHVTREMAAVIIVRMLER